MTTGYQATPFQHWIADDFLPAAILARAENAFAGLGDADFLPHPTGYRFGVCRDVEVLKFLYSSEMKSRLESLFGRKVKRSSRYPVPQYYDYPENSNGLPPHTDADEKRDLAMIIYLNEDWSSASGGELVVMNSPVDVATTIAPLKNRMACLELHPGAWHAVRPTAAGFRRRTLIVDWDFV